MTESAISLREQKRWETSRRITLCAQRLTDAHGIDGFTMDELADAAEVSRRTLFNYFPSKTDAVLGEAPGDPRRPTSRRSSPAARTATSSTTSPSSPGSRSPPSRPTASRSSSAAGCSPPTPGCWPPPTSGSSRSPRSSPRSCSSARAPSFGAGPRPAAAPHAARPLRLRARRAASRTPPTAPWSRCSRPAHRPPAPSSPDPTTHPPHRQEAHPWPPCSTDSARPPTGAGRSSSPAGWCCSSQSSPSPPASPSR